MEDGLTGRDHPAPDAAFDAAFAARAGPFACRARVPQDEAFLIDCAVACSPLAGMLPPPLILGQARLHRAAHDSGWPDAMHRILCHDGASIGHVRIDWGTQPGAQTHLIDIAVLPAHRRRGAAGDALAAWLAVADAHGWRATLQVQADNPARSLYRHWGFVEDAVESHAAIISMTRRGGQP